MDAHCCSEQIKPMVADKKLRDPAADSVAWNKYDSIRKHKTQCQRLSTGLQQNVQKLRSQKKPPATVGVDALLIVPCLYIVKFLKYPSLDAL